ncbi:hypothetical protein PsorP6_002708 [Peronosclerospora sorghi]|uniref:Uncharacterized protein n=1 Tax=Peronosclerospora sorghi TaxID=230839 RepID=A0ACC0WTK4_9STRA|nr:hypothetical protein PsorP6_002708 [Peronosclerospora sorghi]
MYIASRLVSHLATIFDHLINRRQTSQCPRISGNDGVDDRELKLLVANATTGARGIRDPVLLVHEAHLGNVFRVNDQREVTQDGHGQSMLRDRGERRLGGFQGPHDKISDVARGASGAGARAWCVSCARG